MLRRLLLVALAAVAKETDFYKLLKIDKSFNEKQLKSAYREAAKKYHPDKNPGDEKAAKKFALVAEAYDVLSDPKKRRRYDQQRRPPKPNFRKPPPRRPPPPPPPQKPKVPKEVAYAQRRVHRVATTSQLRKIALDSDTGALRRHLVHAFYVSGACEDRLDRELRFPHPFVDAELSDASGAGRWDAHVVFAKTDLDPKSLAHDEASKLAAKLGGDAAAKDDDHCPTFVAVKRGASLRAKDAEVKVFRKRTFKAFETWVYEIVKTRVTFENRHPAETMHVYWHGALRDGVPWGKLAARVPPLAKVSTETYPTHAFSAFLAAAHADAAPDDVDGKSALWGGAPSRTPSPPSPTPPWCCARRRARTRTSCRRAACGGGGQIRARCARTCGLCAGEL
ncbi:hypothetical protein JL720_1632 [Aureococcus anophagefferens]|nr:hypothetical protein JL720_1632 [Aureococcus anophagefferens]